jgi:AraC family transcriptional activator of pobA
MPTTGQFRPSSLRIATMPRVIPNYSLYGDQAQPSWQSTFDFEWIPARSRRYNWEIQPHTHDAFVQILLLQQGGAQVQLDHARISERAPCLILIPAQTVHGFHFASDTDGPVVTAAQRPLESLAQVVMPELVDNIRKPLVMSLASQDSAMEALMPIFLAIERESRRSSTGQVAAALSLITALLVQVARLRQVDAATPMLRDSRKHGQIQKFRALVDARFKQHLPLQDYAAELGITAGQLTRLCREVLGTSSLAVLHARLVHEAQRELVYTDVSIKRLASDLGFVDEAYFGRFFRKHTGLTPREFRARARTSAH